MSSRSLAVLMTSFNRRDTTLLALSLLEEAIAKAASFKVFLVDDASTDGTAQSVAEHFPEVEVINGTGDLYWNQGMRLAWQTAAPERRDFYLWLNDDVELRPGAIKDMFDFYETFPARTIVVGRTVDPNNGETTYGGYRHTSTISRLAWRYLVDGEVECDTLHGNCVLFPSSAVCEIGINSEHYRHGAGDIDYGLRARRAGYKLVQLDEPVASLQLNQAYIDAVSKLTLNNWKFIFADPKGIPWQEWFHMCKAHGGVLWPVNFVWRYLKIVRLK